MLAEFLATVPVVLRRPPTADQEAAISAPSDASMFLVAGPGSGKTTVLALRTLKLIMVDEVDPAGIILTTFTRRAARELRSRVLGWGDEIRRALLAGRLATAEAERLRSTDFNAVLTGTLDSLCETVLGQYRQPGTQAPPVVEEFVSNNLLLRKGLFPGLRFRDADLRAYLQLIRPTSYGQPSARDVVRLVQSLYQRTIHDDIDMGSYRASSQPCPVCGTHPHAGVSVVCDAIAEFETHLDQAGLVDYANLERLFLERITGGLAEFTGTIRQVLVDEYQDTNYLQEQIYFALARYALAAGGGLTVVGDDDQSLYRFRGATVDLFQDFPARASVAIGATPSTIYLAENFRSTETVVDFVNHFAVLDADYQTARVPGKPMIRFARTGAANTPVLGMFRPDTPTLAHDLAALIDSIFNGPGYLLPWGDRVERDPVSGSLLDAALLTFSPNEESGTGRVRLPGALRRELAALATPLEVFNPRGRPLRQVESVELLCGLMLECIDPGSVRQTSITTLTRASVTELTRWRNRARAHLARPATSRSLVRYVNAFGRRAGSWPREIELSDLTYKLVTWIPAMQDDPEGLVYLEVIQRTIVEAARFTAYGGAIVFRPGREDSSIKEAIRSVFVSLAEGAIEVDEDLLDTLPADRLNIMSIHQAKGLQFPLTIVDIGSDFSRAHPAQAIFRYPRTGNDSHQLEDELRGHSRSLSRPTRSGTNRAFDDLIRTYFVAYSRAQDVLLLVGNQRLLTDTPSPVQHIAAGWDRDGTWRWGPGLPNLMQL